jgi:hypothetical protein
VSVSLDVLFCLILRAIPLLVRHLGSPFGRRPLPTY